MNQKVDILIFHECKGRHAHEYPQLLVPLEAPMRIQVGKEEYEVTPREVCFIPAEMQHQCNYIGKLLMLNFSREITEDRDAVLLSSPMIVSLRGQITQLVDLIQAEIREDPDSQAVQYLYSYLYRKIIENGAAPSIRYIGEHYDLPITVEQLAKMERYNVTYYNDWFKQRTGLSPSMYLRRIRVDKAKELLADTNFTVMEIAVMVGYSSNSTFTRAFHSITGMTPKAYRECPCFKRKLS